MNQSELIKSEISFLKNKQREGLVSLKNQFHSTFENLKPINLLKETLVEIDEQPDFKSNLLNSAVGLSTGYLSKILIIGNSSNPFKKILGGVVEFAVRNVVIKNSEKIISTIETFFHLISSSKNDKKRALQALENNRLIDN